MPDSPQTPQSEKQAKLLTVALEVFRRSLIDSVSFLMANRDRKIDTAPPWARNSVQPEASFPEYTIPQSIAQKPIPLADSKPTTEPNVYGMATPTPPAAKPDLPPIPLAGDKPPETFSIKQDWKPGWFGGDKPMEPTSNVSAFDRPQAVIIVGPRPLPVKLDKALEAPATIPRSERGEMATGNTMGKMLARQFMAVVGPLYLLSTILNQTGSGMGVFQKSIQLMAASLAPIVLPVFMTLAAGLMTLSDIIWNKINPALGDFYSWAIKFGLGQAEKKLGDAKDVVDLAGVVRGLTRGDAPNVADMPRMLDAAVRNIDPSGTVASFMRNVGGSNDLMNWTARRFGFDNFQQGAGAAGLQTGSGGLIGPAVSAATGSTASPATSLADALRGNMQDAIESLKRSMGVRATYSGLEDVGKQAQLAALNADPIEMRAAQRVIEAIQQFQEAFDRAAGQPVPQPNTFNANGLATSFAMAASTFSRAP